MLSQDTPLTFLFTDVVGSTSMWQRHGDRMHTALERHDKIIKDQAEAEHGYVFAGGGDGFGVVFPDPRTAVSAALSIQDALSDLTVGDDLLAVRMGIHTGIAQARDDDYFGLAVNRAARLASAAHGGQILVSSAAAAHLDPAATRLLGSYRLPDLLEPMEIHQVGDREFPPVRALDPERHNLPERYTSLVGREQLLDDLMGILHSHRLVTLVGPGGIGKTSMAVSCGARLSAASAEADREVWLAELDQLVSGGDVVPLVTSLFGLDPSHGWERKVGARNAVLILDNAEHLIDDVAHTVAGVLRAGKRLRILTTSREPLQIPGERVIEVPPLGLDTEAVQLLMERSGERHTPESLVTELVASTDGVPLALELVASHVGRVPPEALVESLRDHGIASLSARGVANRHRTTSDALAWSYDLLSPEEQRAFRALGVFSRAFTLQAASTVGEVPAHTILSLAERSLIHRVEDRFRLLAPIKEFALDRLTLAEEFEAARDRRTDFVLDEIADIAGRLAPRDGAGWEKETSVAREDILETAKALVDAEDLERLEKLYLALPGQWGVHQHQLRKALDILDRALPLLWNEAANHRWSIFRHAWCLDQCGREPDALPIVERLRHEAATVGDGYLAAACDALELRIVSVDPRVEPSELERLQAAAEEYSKQTEWWEPEGMLFGRGAHAAAREDFATATRLLEEVTRRLSPSSHNYAVGALNLAECDRMLGDPERALERLDSIEGIRGSLVFGFETQRAHSLIELNRLDEAYETVMRLVDLDIKHSGQETSDPFCAAADYLRAVGDHQAATQLLANMLGDQEPWSYEQRRVISEGRAALGESFDTVWARGRHLSPASLHALLREESSDR